MRSPRPSRAGLTLLLAALLVRLAGPSLPLHSARAEDWPRFRGPGAGGATREKGPPPDWSAERNLLWKTPLPGPGGSSPVTFGTNIFLTAYSGYAVPGQPAGSLSALTRHVMAFQRSDGKPLWSRELSAVQPEQDKVRDHGYASSTPAVDADRLYVFLGKSGVHAFRHDGQPLWKASVGDQVHGWGSATSPVLHRDLVVINASVESESLVALNRATGKEVWRAPGLKESWNTPVLVPNPDGRLELVVAIAGKVLGFDPDTGAPLWSCATGIAWYMVPSLVHSQGIVYVIGGRTGGSLAVRTGGRGDVTSSHRLWTLNKGSNVPSPLLHDGHLYWLHENLGIAYCAEAASGRLIYEERMPGTGPFYASPVLADGRIHAVTREGRTIVLAASPKFEILGRAELRDRSSFDASPILNGDRLLIRSDRFLYCIGSR